MALNFSGSGAFLSQSILNVPIGMVSLHAKQNTSPLKDRFCYGSYRITADARIDNRLELSELLGLHPSTSETELIVRAYQRWSFECPSYLMGDFAFALWDQDSQLLFAARDPMGVKQLHFIATPQFVGLATQARQLTAHPSISERLSALGLLMWTLNQYDERHTLFEDVRGLESGFRLIAQKDTLKVEPYWFFNSVVPIRYKKAHDYEDHLGQLLKRCVADRCPKDGSVTGSMLSGGMDSSSVTALSHTQNQNILPFSFRFKSLSDCDESSYSQMVADQLGLSIHWVDCESFWPLKGACTDFSTRELPFQCWDLMDHHILMALSQAGGKVLLTGHGGDSLMTGIPAPLFYAEGMRQGHLGHLPLLIKELKHRNQLNLKFLIRFLISPNIPLPLKRYVKRFFKQTPQRLPWVPREVYKRHKVETHLFSQLNNPFKDLRQHHLFQLIGPNSSGIRRVIHWYANLAAPYGIKVHHPFFDRRLAEFILAIPPELLRQEPRPKTLLRRAMSGILPEPILKREEKPSLRSFYHYGIYQEQSRIKALFSESRLAACGFIDSRALLDEISAYLEEDGAQTTATFLSTLNAELWFRNERLARG